MDNIELEDLFREKATIAVDDGVLARDFGYYAKKGEISHRNRNINQTTRMNTSASQFALSCEHFLKAPIIYHDLRQFSNLGAYSSNAEINAFIDSALKRPLWIQSDVFKRGDIRKNMSLSAPESAKKERFSGHDLFAYYQLQNPVIKTLINHEFLSHDGEDIFNYIDFAILTQDFIQEDSDGKILLPQKQLEIYTEHKNTFETKRYSSTHDRDLSTTEDDIENLIQISSGLETIMCTLFPTYDPSFDFTISSLEKQLGDNIFNFYHLKNSMAKPILHLDKISNFYLRNDFSKNEFENLLNSLNQINNSLMLDEQNKEIFKNIYLNLCIYLKHCSVEKGAKIYFSPQTFKRIENYCKIVMNSNLFNIGGHQLRNTSYFIKNKQDLEKAMIISQSNEDLIKPDSKKMLTVGDKINEFINLLNNGKIDVFKRYTNCNFSDGTSTGLFWEKYKDGIIKKLFEELKDDSNYDKARDYINEFMFSLNTEAKIMMFIEMLNDRNLDVLRSHNREGFKDYPNIKIGRFWQTNKYKIKEILFGQLKDDPKYNIAREIIMEEQSKEDNIKKYFSSLGFDSTELIRMFKRNGDLSNCSVEKIKETFETLLLMGYNKDDTIKIISNCPYLFNLAKQSIITKVNEIQNLGYSFDDVIKMTVSYPNIFILNIENIKMKIYDMVNLGYTRDEVMQITVGFPSIFALNIENIREKKEFYDSIGLNNILLKKPLLLIQSVELSYARYKFLTSQGITINDSNFNLLFISSSEFKKRYNIDSSDLMEKYKRFDDSDDNHKHR